MPMRGPRYVNLIPAGAVPASLENTPMSRPSYDAPEPCQPAQAIDRIADRIRSAIGHVSETNGVLHSAGDRAFGAQPPLQGGATGGPINSLGALSEIDGLLDTLNEALRTNSDQAHRFGAL